MQLGSHVDSTGDDDDDDDEGGSPTRSKSEEALSAAEKLPSGEDAACERLQDAESALASVSSNSIGVLCGLILYCGAQPSPAAAIAFRELVPLDQPALATAFGGMGNVLRWLRSYVPPTLVKELERSLLQMLVAHCIESLLASKVNAIVDEAAVGAPSPAGLMVLQMVLKFVQASFTKLTEKQISREVTALQALLSKRPLSVT